VHLPGPCGPDSRFHCSSRPGQMQRRIREAANQSNPQMAPISAGSQLRTACQPTALSPRSPDYQATGPKINRSGYGSTLRKVAGLRLQFSPRPPIQVRAWAAEKSDRVIDSSQISGLEVALPCPQETACLNESPYLLRQVSSSSMVNLVRRIPFVDMNHTPFGEGVECVSASTRSEWDTARVNSRRDTETQGGRGRK